MQQYFGSAISPVTIEDKETIKHMFQVMRLKKRMKVTLVFDDGIKRLARAGCGSMSVWIGPSGQWNRPFKSPSHPGFPKETSWVYHSKSDGTKFAKSGAFLPWSVAKWDGKEIG